jgi:hypothetical protein
MGPVTWHQKPTLRRRRPVNSTFNNAVNILISRVAMATPERQPGRLGSTTACSTSGRPVIDVVATPNQCKRRCSGSPKHRREQPALPARHHAQTEALIVNRARY